MPDIRNPLSKVVSSDRLRSPHPLKQRIRDLGLRQIDLAVALGCHDSDLSRWLNHKREMPRNCEERLQEILDAVEAESGEVGA